MARYLPAVRTDDFDYHLPTELIAQEPAPKRADARLLAVDRSTGGLRHLGIRDLVDELREGDLLVTNDTRVIPARLHGRRDTGGKAELLLLAPTADGDVWDAMVRCGGSLRAGERIDVRHGAASGVVEFLAAPEGGRCRVRGVDEPLTDVMTRCGKLPLPPYIRRDVEDTRDDDDSERYQTVFAREPGAVAAPTAGLHLGAGLLDTLAERGVRHVSLTLHVGPGTFQPVRTEDLDQHEMHSESFAIPAEVAEAVRATRAARGRIVAVGTTTVRALEASAAGSTDGLPAAGAADTALFIRPGYRFCVVDALLTNFHLPRSTLLCLVSAFASRERVLDAYRTAVAERYRFYSYGDAMLIAGPSAT